MTRPTVDPQGNRFWHDPGGAYHRARGPAIEYPDGAKAWFSNGRLESWEVGPNFLRRPWDERDGRLARVLA